MQEIDELMSRNKDYKIVKLNKEMTDIKEKCSVKSILVNSAEKLLKKLNNNYTQLQDELSKQIKQLKYYIAIKKATARESINLQQSCIN